MSTTTLPVCTACGVILQEGLHLCSGRSVIYPQITTREQPYRCPVCGGKGLVPNNFYLVAGSNYNSDNTSPDTCRSCGGKGIVWR